MPVKRAYPIAVRRGSVTVKIYRQKSADVFTVAFYEHGQRQRLSFRDEGEARKGADEVADRLSRHNGASLTLAGTDLKFASVRFCPRRQDGAALELYGGCAP